MTTDKSNLLTAGILRMRKCYSITDAGAEPGLRGCTQEVRAGKCSKPSSRIRPAAASCGALPRRSTRRGGPWEGCRATAPVRPVTALARPPGLRAAEPGLRPQKLRGADGGWGEEPRSQKVPTPSAPSKGFTHVAGTIRETYSERLLCLLHQCGPSFPTPAVLAASSICPGHFRVDGSTFKVLCRVVFLGGSWCLNTI
jgi:hypothetical protein